MERFLEKSPIIDFDDPEVTKLAKSISEGCADDEEIAKRAFLFVRDQIRHSGDHRDEITTCLASEVLKYKTGWCYAKSHLLAALLRANGIPTGFCYQRLSCSEYREGSFCLHGLNAVYLKNYGWYRVDARGNKTGVDAHFTPPVKQLAFTPQQNEYDLPEIYTQPLEIVVKALHENRGYAAMVENFPDMD